jgi:hypothetical protein
VAQGIDPEFKPQYHKKKKKKKDSKCWFLFGLFILSDMKLWHLVTVCVTKQVGAVYYSKTHPKHRDNRQVSGLPFGRHALQFSDFTLS